MERARTSVGNEECHYVVVRQDLPRGLLAAQVVHAVGESVIEQHRDGTYAVVLAATGASQLEELSKRLTKAGIRHKRIVENDDPYKGELMALGLEPAPRSVIKRHLRSLPLLR